MYVHQNNKNKYSIVFKIVFVSDDQWKDITHER